MESITYNRFLDKVIPVPEAGCWLWLASILSTGYGCFKLGKVMSAHRASWIIHRGSIPEGMQVLHKCDTKSCVNPDHLYLGDHAQNMRDVVERGQQQKGSRHWKNRHPERQRGDDAPHRTLTSADVIEIRKSPETQTALAKRFGISVQQINRIVHKKSWVTIEE